MLKFSGVALSLFAAMLLVTHSGFAQEKQAEEPAEQQQKKLQVNKRASSSMCSFIVCDYKTGRIVDPKTFDIVRVTPLTDKNGTKLTPAQQKAGTKKPGQISKKMTIGIMEDLKVGNAKKRAFEVQGAKQCPPKDPPCECKRDAGSQPSKKGKGPKTKFTYIRLVGKQLFEVEVVGNLFFADFPGHCQPKKGKS